MIRRRLYSAQKNLIQVLTYSPVANSGVKVKSLVCKQASCVYLLPLFDRQYTLRNMPYTLPDALLMQSVQKVRDHPNVLPKVSVPNLNRG